MQEVIQVNDIQHDIHLQVFTGRAERLMAGRTIKQGSMASHFLANMPNEDHDNAGVNMDGGITTDEGTPDEKKNGSAKGQWRTWYFSETSSTDGRDAQIGGAVTYTYLKQGVSCGCLKTRGQGKHRRKPAV